MLKNSFNLLQIFKHALRKHGGSQSSIVSVTVCSLILLLFCATSATAATYYVDAIAGSDLNVGTSTLSPLKTLQRVNTISLNPGDSVLLKRGALWTDGLDIKRSGLVQNNIYFGAYGDGATPIIRYAKVSGSFVTLSDLIVDRNKEASDAIQIKGANNNLRNLVVRNGTRDGIDISQASNILVENCLVHHFLNGSFTQQVDAHGIVVTESQGITIRNTEIHHVSGDSFQADPSRNANNMTNNVLIENCHFWTAPLTEDFNSGWVKTSHLAESAKQYPGENGIDTKVVKDGWGAVPRMQLTIRDSQFHGWMKDGYVANKAALNLKEKIEAVIEGVTVYDNEIAFRVRGGRGNANVTVNNANIYNSEIAFRTEDDLENLSIYDSYFGENIGEIFKTVSSSTGFETWSIVNNQFLNTKPSLASDPSNTVISDSSSGGGLAIPTIPQNLTIMTASYTPPPQPDPDPPQTNPDPPQTDPDPPQTSPDPPLGKPGSHSHFDNERTKPGVIFYRAWRSKEEVDSDWWTYGMSIPPGHSNAAWYDASYDGALFPIRNINGNDISFGSLQPFYRDGGQPTISSGGAIWIQYEYIFDQNFYDNIVAKSNFDSMKLIRLYQKKGLCGNEDRFFTLTWLGNDNNALETAVSSSCYGWPSQGQDTNYTIPGGTWTRITIKFDISNDYIRAYTTNISTGETQEFFSYKTQFPSTLSITKFIAQLQSTSRNHSPGSTSYDYFCGIRNLIVSNDSIEFAN